MDDNELRKQLSALTYNDLRKEAKQNSVPAKGKKVEIIEALIRKLKLKDEEQNPDVKPQSAPEQLTEEQMDEDQSIPTEAANGLALEISAEVAGQLNPDELKADGGQENTFLSLDLSSTHRMSSSTVEANHPNLTMDDSVVEDSLPLSAGASNVGDEQEYEEFPDEHAPRPEDFESSTELNSTYTKDASAFEEDGIDESGQKIPSPLVEEVLHVDKVEVAVLQLETKEDENSNIVAGMKLEKSTGSGSQNSQGQSQKSSRFAEAHQRAFEAMPTLKEDALRKDERRAAYEVYHQSDLVKRLTSPKKRLISPKKYTRTISHTNEGDEILLPSGKNRDHTSASQPKKMKFQFGADRYKPSELFKTPAPTSSSMTPSGSGSRRIFSGQRLDVKQITMSGSSSSSGGRKKRDNLTPAWNERIERATPTSKDPEKSVDRALSLRERGRSSYVPYKGRFTYVDTTKMSDREFADYQIQKNQFERVEAE